MAYTVRILYRDGSLTSTMSVDYQSALTEVETALKAKNTASVHVVGRELILHRLSEVSRCLVAALSTPCPQAPPLAWSDRAFSQVRVVAPTGFEPALPP